MCQISKIFLFISAVSKNSFIGTYVLISKFLLLTQISKIHFIGTYVLKFLLLTQFSKIHFIGTYVLKFLLLTQFSKALLEPEFLISLYYQRSFQNFYWNLYVNFLNCPYY